MAARTFEDSAGATWEVFEVQRASNKAGAVSAGLEKGWLAFVSGPTKRRLAPFPPDWTSATPSELERLCAAARAAQPRLAGRDDQAPPRDRKEDLQPVISVEEGASVEGTVRAFAHRARALGLPAIEALVRLRVLLQTNHPEPDSEARDMRRVRRWFVETYYFERGTGDAAPPGQSR